MQSSVLIVPYAQYLPAIAVKGITELVNAGCPVFFFDGLPDRICEGGEIPAEWSSYCVLKIDDPKNFIDRFGLRKIILNPSNDRIRVMHCIGEQELLYIFHEGAESYHGTIRVAALYFWIMRSEQWKLKRSI